MLSHFGGSKAGRSRVVATAVSYFNRPTRRKAITYPLVNTSNCFNYSPPATVGRSDYAACAGDGSDWPVSPIPADLATRRTARHAGAAGAARRRLTETAQIATLMVKSFLERHPGSAVPRAVTNRP